MRRRKLGSIAARDAIARLARLLLGELGRPKENFPSADRAPRHGSGLVVAEARGGLEDTSVGDQDEYAWAVRAVLLRDEAAVANERCLSSIVGKRWAFTAAIRHARKAAPQLHRRSQWTQPKSFLDDLRESGAVEPSGSAAQKAICQHGGRDGSPEGAQHTRPGPREPLTDRFDQST